MKKVDIYNNKSLGELDWDLGDLIALDNSNPNLSEPFILAMPNDIFRGLNGEI